MHAFLTILLVALAAFTNVTVQIASHRFVCRGELVASLFAGLLAGLIVLSVGAMTNHVSESTPAHLLAALLMYLALSFTFLCLVAASETSIRFEILRQLGVRVEGITLDELERAYSNRVLVRTRLDRLLNSGEISKIDGTYRLARRRVLLVARIFLACKLLIFGTTNEFALPRARPGVRRLHRR